MAPNSRVIFNVLLVGSAEFFNREFIAPLVKLVPLTARLSFKVNVSYSEITMRVVPCNAIAQPGSRQRDHWCLIRAFETGK